MMPGNDRFYELFTNLDKWRYTQGIVDVVGFADHALEKFSDDELREGFAAMNSLGLSLGLEIGCIKEHGPDFYGRAMADQQRPVWQRFIDLGANLTSVAFDEPLLNVIEIFPEVWAFLGDKEAQFEFAVEQSAEYIKIIREYFPQITLGDIEVFPTMTIAEVIRWIDALEARIKQKGAAGMDFFRFDVNWYDPAFERSGYTQETGWREIKKLEDYCKSIDLPFSMIYWAPDVFRFMEDGKAITDSRADEAWYDQVMTQGKNYYDAGGRPDQYVIETWVTVGEDHTWMPPTMLPEDGVLSFTRSVKDLYDTYIKPQRQ